MKKLNLVITLIVILLVILFNSLFVVMETERAVILRLGEITRNNIPPGLHVKIPFIEKVVKINGMIITLDSQPKRYLTSEKKALIVDSYVKWRIHQVDKFYTAASGSIIIAQNLIASRVDTGLRNKFGERTLIEVVSGQRDELMDSLTKEMNIVSEQELGVKIIDIRVKKIDLPTEVSDSVFERMKTEREREARELRSQGREIAEGIRAEADREKVTIEANAYEEAESIKGEGDAEATKIYANAYSKNPEFYEFYRSMKAYEKSLSNGKDILVLDLDNEFFRYLK